MVTVGHVWIGGGRSNILEADGHRVDAPVEWTVVGAGGHGVDAQGKMDLSGRK